MIKIEEKLNRGEIYIVNCKTNKKSYIGQAKCYVSDGNNKYKKWGTNGRWKSHIYEARRHINHSRLLDGAIRKYGENNFIVKKLCECELDKLDYWEIEYIKIFNTITPNGYNLLKGGKNRNISDE